MRAYERLLKYVKVHTTSDESTGTLPSTQRQFTLAHILAEEMQEIGISDVKVDDKCYVYGCIPATSGYEDSPRIGFIAHMDTSPDASGENVKPVLRKDYDGSDVSVNEAVFELVKKKGGTTPIYTYSPDNIKRVSRNIQKYADLLPEDGHVYFTLVPFPKLARRFTGNLELYSGWQSNLFDEMAKVTSDKVRYYDSLKILEPHMLEGEELFLYGNHQWNIKGSYYVYYEMIKSQGLTPTPYDEYDYKVLRPQTGSWSTMNIDTYELLYPLAPSKNYRVSHIDKRQEIPFMAYDTATTSSYLYGNSWRPGCVW